MGKHDDAERPHLANAEVHATLEVGLGPACTVVAPRRDRLPMTTPAIMASRPRSVGPHRPRPGLGEYLIVARRRP